MSRASGPAGQRRRPTAYFARWLRRVNLTFAFAAGVAMMLMMVFGAADVISTNVFGEPIPAVFEFIATMMVVVVFFSVSLAQARRAHVRVEVIVTRLPRRLQYLTNIVQYSLTVVFFGLIAWFGWQSGMHSLRVGEYAPGLLNWPIFPARFALAIGASLMTVQSAFDLICHLAGRDDAAERRHTT